MKNRIKSILEKIEDIEYFLSKCDNKITIALNDRVYKPAIRMQLIAIAEQFNKLKEENEFEILEHFDKKELRGMSAVRNFIAHDYDSVDNEILENVLRIHLPQIKEKANKILG